MMVPDKFGKHIRKRIVNDFNRGVSQKELSIKYNVHKSSVSRILSRFKKLSLWRLLLKAVGLEKLTKEPML